MHWTRVAHYGGPEPVYECGRYTFEWDISGGIRFDENPVFGEIWYKNDDNTGTLLAKVPRFTWKEIVVFEEEDA